MFRLPFILYSTAKQKIKGKPKYWTENPKVWIENVTLGATKETASEKLKYLKTKKKSMKKLPKIEWEHPILYEECSICCEFMTFFNNKKIKPCNHRFHKHCIERWRKRKNTCPLCRCQRTD